MSTLFTPITLGDYELSNRIFMAPLTRARSLPGAVPNSELKAAYYSQRAGAGLIIAEATAVSPEGLGWLDACGIWNDEQEKAWQPVTQAVHEKGGKIFLQIWHMGATVARDFLNGQPALSSSNVKLEGEVRTPKNRKQTLEEPRALSLDEIQEVQAQYVNAAKRAIAAGFDGVEIHAANGFLIDQFTRDSANTREDSYGGSIENRIRFALEVTKKVCEAIGSGKVGIRVSPTNQVWGIKDSDHRATFSSLVESLNSFKLAYLHILEPKPGSGHPLDTIDYMTPYLRTIYEGTYIVNGGYSKESGNQILNDGGADAIAYGTDFIANPDLVKRFQLNVPLAQADPDTFYTNDAKGYADYPTYSQTE